MEQQLKEIKERGIERITEATNLKDLNEVRVAYLGRKGPITDLLKGMGKLPAEERPKMGALVNVIRESVTEILEERMGKLEEQAINEQLEKESIDVTLPSRPARTGNHPQPPSLRPEDACHQDPGPLE